MKKLFFIGLSLLLASCSETATVQDLTSINDGVNEEVKNTALFLNPMLTVESGRVSVSIEALNDVNGDSSVSVFYCNQTQYPACAPNIKVGDLERSDKNFTLTLEQLLAPNEEGDQVHFQLRGDDPNGVESQQSFSLLTEIPT